MDALRFEQDIRPLFRDHDRESMEWAFDLWDYEDVKTNAEDILDQLTSGRMPCDGAWPEERIALFRRWTEGGTPA